MKRDGFYRNRSLVFSSMIVLGILFMTVACGQGDSIQKGSAVFVHPDGSSVEMWGALRLLEKGPDGMIHWDQMEKMGVYRGHLANSTNSSSNGGATVHAFGIKADYGHYGISPRKPFKSLSGKDHSIMIEAREAGLAVGLINSGHICEPGTGVFVANAEKRAMSDTISAQIIQSGADILFSGGEVYLLPEGVMGKHGKPGIRMDGANLVELAETLGYKVIYTREELLALPRTTEKVLGIFAAGHTFNDKSEEVLKAAGLSYYQPDAPTLEEMTRTALEILGAKDKRFLLVVEEEGTDNFGNANNAPGTLTALGRADAAIGEVMNYIERHPGTLLVVAADSNAGGLQTISVRDSALFTQPLAAQTSNGAPVDGQNGTGTLPFVSGPDQFGNRLYFAISWAGYNDFADGIIARAHGLNAHLLPTSVDNTDIYRIMYATLFGVQLP